jgi:chromosome segregation ATPase
MRHAPTPSAAFAVCAALLLAAAGAGAQAPAAKPADGKPLTMSNSGSGKLLTRDELRACFKRRDELGVRLADLEAQRKAMDAERDAITQERSALAGEREAVKRKTDAVSALEPRMVAFKQKVDDWQARVSAFNDSGRGGPMADRQRADLQREQTALNTAQKELEAERVAVTSSAQEAIAAFNAKAGAVEARATDWNARNGKLNDTTQVAGDDRQAWATDCANRRYREDDEIAIQRGQ